MIRKVFLHICDGIAGLFEGGVNEQEIRLFCSSEYMRISAIQNKPFGVNNDLDETAKIMDALGWLENNRKIDSQKKEINPEKSADLQKWLSGLQNCYVIENGVMVSGSSRYLDIIDERDEKENQEFINYNMERLLRHVEVQRKKSLSKFTTGLTSDQIWLERYDTSILISRYARRHGDLRFLNTAFKLNDWFYKDVIGRRKALECQARFVLVLCEQELSSMELLK